MSETEYVEDDHPQKAADEKPKAVSGRWRIGYYEGLKITAGESITLPPGFDDSLLIGPESPIWKWADTSSLVHTLDVYDLPYPTFDWENPDHRALVDGCLWAIVFDESAGDDIPP